MLAFFRQVGEFVIGIGNETANNESSDENDHNDDLVEFSDENDTQNNVEVPSEPLIDDNDKDDDIDQPMNIDTSIGNDNSNTGLIADGNYLNDDYFDNTSYFDDDYSEFFTYNNIKYKIKKVLSKCSLVEVYVLSICWFNQYGWNLTYLACGILSLYSSKWLHHNGISLESIGSNVLDADDPVNFFLENTVTHNELHKLFNQFSPKAIIDFATKLHIFIKKHEINKKDKNGNINTNQLNNIESEDFDFIITHYGELQSIHDYIQIIHNPTQDQKSVDTGCPAPEYTDIIKPLYYNLCDNKSTPPIVIQTSEDSVDIPGVSSGLLHFLSEKLVSNDDLSRHLIICMDSQDGINGAGQLEPNGPALRSFELIFGVRYIRDYMIDAIGIARSIIFIIKKLTKTDDEYTTMFNSEMANLIDGADDVEKYLRFTVQEMRLNQTEDDIASTINNIHEEWTSDDIFVVKNKKNYIKYYEAMRIQHQEQFDFMLCRSQFCHLEKLGFNFDHMELPNNCHSSIVALYSVYQSLCVHIFSKRRQWPAEFTLKNYYLDSMNKLLNVFKDELYVFDGVDDIAPSSEGSTCIYCDGKSKKYWGCDLCKNKFHSKCYNLQVTNLVRTDLLFCTRCQESACRTFRIRNPLDPERD